MSRVNAFTSVERIQAATQFLIELRKLGSPCVVVFFQEPQGFPDNLACGVVAAGFYFGADELLQFGRKGNIHYKNSSPSRLRFITKNVNLRHRLNCQHESFPASYDRSPF